MKKLMKMFKDLPREVKMMLAMAGLASPVGVVYFLRRFFPGLSYFTMILIICGIIAVVCIVAFLLSFVFKTGGQRRSRKMAQELSAEGAGGPAGMDVSAAIKANNEKFFTAVREMKKEVGVSVYDLPWYIVIGDSGCGKTYLINNGGLTFSRGRPEGYQLGTLNYNWWFTEDAIFIDMAGRLCNPQDDGDRREWEAFLNTVGKGRKGYPINGAILCVSAEHLLQDPPEKHEADANIALERLRDLQSKLGVTFATYIVVTKCDKILGFMQFFDRADRDITIKNQMFGWSRPGEFTELSDPERFKEDFGSVYGRLNELRIRRLQDEADEIDLGLAYSFPEEFRELLDPMQTYVRTLFPMIKNPRAVKNLLFRGIYFTSATQEGLPILRHLKERLGEEAADQFSPLEALFPNKRPHFIKDVLFKKVFPEHGLVFRNEQQVVRNRKLAKYLMVATIGLAVVLFGAFFWSFSKFRGLILDPRDRAGMVAAKSEELRPPRALKRAREFEQDIRTLEDHSVLAGVLSVGFGHDEPVNHLKSIRARLVELSIAQALADVDATLAAGDQFSWSSPEQAEKYTNALIEYVRWYGCMNESGGGRVEDAQAGFNTLCAVVPADTESIVHEDTLHTQAAWYFDTIRANGGSTSNPAALLRRADVDPKRTILQAVNFLYEKHLRRLATLDENHPDPELREWVRIRNECDRVDQSYEELLAIARRAERISALDGLQAFQNDFRSKFDTFQKALGELEWRAWAPGEYAYRIPKLWELLKAQRQQWREWEGRFESALATCGVDDPDIQATINSITRGGKNPVRSGCDAMLWASLEKIGATHGDYGSGLFDDEEKLRKQIRDVFDVYGHIFAISVGEEGITRDRLELTPDVGTVRERLRTIDDSLAHAKLEFSAQDLEGLTLEHLADRLDGHLEEMKNKITFEMDGTIPDKWQPAELGQLSVAAQELIRLGKGMSLLNIVAARLDQAGQFGIAGLYPFDTWAAAVPSPYTISIPQRSDFYESQRSEPKLAEEVKVDSPASGRSSRDAIWGGQDSPQKSAERVARPRGSSYESKVPAYVTHDFLNQRVIAAVRILWDLRRMGEGNAFLDDRGLDRRLNEVCEEKLRDATRRYLSVYVAGWGQGYGDLQLGGIAELSRDVKSWDGLNDRLTDRTKAGGRYEIANNLYEALRWILRAIPFATYNAERGRYWASFGVPEWEEASEWMNDAIQVNWDSQKLGRFATGVELPSGLLKGNAPPWEEMADLFREEWKQLSEQIDANSPMPSDFSNYEEWRGSAISWGRIKKLCDDYDLFDEARLTGALMEFEKQAQELLSTEMTAHLAAIQQKLFKGKQADEGWPYLPGAAYSDEGLNTVDLQDFKSFLVQVRRAQEAYGALDHDLPDDVSGLSSRRTFLRQCADWFKFLDLDVYDVQKGPKPLQITVSGHDSPGESACAGQKVDEGAQLTAGFVALKLGLKLTGEDKGHRADELLIATRLPERLDPHNVTWEWTSVDGEMKVRLEDIKSRYKVEKSEQALGRSSPLAFCAYLHRYGEREVNDPARWCVLHPFERFDPTAGRQDRQTVGELLLFDLGDRPLPEPIQRLEEPRAPRRRGPID